ncbi:MAG: hypothetical protein GY866_35335 [Proteobacteria bacterium]|nr:hypothetical protein [Pseudomonadota bacterium]
MKMISSRLLFFLVLLFLVFPACDHPKKTGPAELDDAGAIEKRFTLGGAPVQVVVKLSQAEFALTDYLTVEVETEFVEGVQATPPFLSETVYNPLLLVENPRESTYWNEQNDRLANKWEYTFEPVASGEFSLKPFTIYFRLDKEKTDDPAKWPVHEIHTEEISYRVSSVEVGDEDDIRDVKGLILPDYNVVPVAVTTATLMAVFLSIWLVIRFGKRGEKRDLQLQTEIDFFREALKRLDNLEGRDLIGKEEFERLHTELSAILRYYVENYFGMRPQEQTTEEFINDIRYSSRFSTEQQGVLQQFLALADLVKFATFDPGPEASREAMQSVREFVSTTGKADEI